MLNKWNLKIRDFGTKEESRYALEHIQVTPNETVVTDGHRLVIVTKPSIELEQFPQIPNFEPSTEFEPFLLHTEQAKKLEGLIPKEKTLTVLNNAAVGIANGELSVATTDLDMPSIMKAQKVEATFPQWQMILPSSEPAVEITFDLNVLAPVLNQMAKFAADGKRNPVATIRIVDANRQIRIDAQNEETGQKMVAVVMPYSPKYAVPRHEFKQVTKPAVTAADVRVTRTKKKRKAA